MTQAACAAACEDMSVVENMKKNAANKSKFHESIYMPLVWHKGAAQENACKHHLVGM